MSLGLSERDGRLCSGTNKTKEDPSGKQCVFYQFFDHPNGVFHLRIPKKNAKRNIESTRIQPISLKSEPSCLHHCLLLTIGNPSKQLNKMARTLNKTMENDLWNLHFFQRRTQWIMSMLRILWKTKAAGFCGS